jgi:phosphatidylserine/phosphatidylglycerophosphate/cardiolipin synthase-like enzyme
MRKRLLATVVATAGLAALATTGPSAPPAQAAGLTSRAYFNDPDAAGQNNIRYLFHERFEGAPAGATVRVDMWNISDSYVTDAMSAAHRRGVNVRVIMARVNCNSDLVDALGTDTSRRSWIMCVAGSSRGPGGTMHQKSLTFTSTGGSDYVTIVGSANMTEEAWRDQWVDMYQFANRKGIFDAYNDVFAVQKRNDDSSQNFFSYSFNGGVGRANFYPVNNPNPSAADDPVVDRLNNLPSDANTSITVANYAFHGTRGNWIASLLIQKKQAGANVRVITGPPSGDALETRLREAGIPVTRAFDSDCSGGDHVDLSCNYIHLKAMTAKSFVDGTWQYQTFTGSDNWGIDALTSDEVTHRIGGKLAYDTYEGFLNEIQNRYTAVG